MIFITGGTGLVGSHLLFQFCQAGARPRALYREASSQEKTKLVFSYYSANHEDLFQQIEWVQGEITDPESYAKHLEGVSEIYHCAALVSFQPRDRDKLFEVNQKGTEHLINAALNQGVKNFIHLSSVAALGSTGKSNLPVDEETVWKNSPELSNYARSKYAAELEVWRGQEEGLQCLIVNPSIILGPGFWNQGSGALYGRAAKGMHFYSGGSNDFVHVRDLINFLLSLRNAEAFGQRYILGGTHYSYREFFELLSTAFGQKPPRFLAPPWLGSIIWRLERMRTFLFGGQQLLTKESARAAQKNLFWNSEKAKEKTGLSFGNLAQQVAEDAFFYRKKN